MCHIHSDVRTVVASIKVYSLEDKKRPGYSCFSNPYRTTTATTASTASLSHTQPLQLQQTHTTVVPSNRVSSSGGTMRQYDLCEEYTKRLLLLA